MTLLRVCWLQKYLATVSNAFYSRHILLAHMRLGSLSAGLLLMEGQTNSVYTLLAMGCRVPTSVLQSLPGRVVGNESLAHEKLAQTGPLVKPCSPDDRQCNASKHASFGDGSNAR